MSTIILPTPRRLIAAVLMALLFLGSTAGTARAAVDLDAEQDFVRRINKARVAKGLQALVVRTDLVDVARSHSKVMASSADLHHNPDLGSDVTNWQRVTENVGVGPDSATLHQAFMDSSGHRANILDAKVTEIGVGVEVRSGRMWVTEVFRLPKSTSTSTSSGSGSTGGVPVTGDWNGDGVDTPGWFKDGRWTMSNNIDGSGPYVSLSYGKAGDKPVAGDWDGNGTDTVGVVRGNLFILRNEYKRDAEDIKMYYGKSTDKPVVGDWDGNGTDTLGVVRGNLFILRNVYKRGAKDILMYYGKSTDKPVVGDWDGNGTDTLGVVRGNLWIMRNVYKRGAEDILMYYGKSTDAPVYGDWDGDGVDTLGIVRSDLWVLRSEYKRDAEDAIFRF